MRAPSASADSFAQTTDGATALLTKAKVAKPQSAPAITRSRPTMSAYWQIRCATSRGCSTKLVVEINDAGDQDLVVGDFCAAQILPFMRMARIGRLERQSGRPRPHAHVEDLGQRDVVGVRAFVISPAQMHAHRLRRDIGGRLVERCDVALRNAQELAVRQVLILVVPGRAEIGRIDLQNETGPGDRLIFLFQRIGQRLDIGVFVPVIAVRHKFCQHPGRGGVHEGLGRLCRGAGRGEILQVGFQRRPVRVGDRAGAARHRFAAEP